MTRIKELPIGSEEIPDYKSDPARIIRSQRKAYDNIRKKVANKSETAIAMQGKLRDTQKSREEWKSRAKSAEAKLAELERNYESLQEDLKKRGK